MSPLGISTTNLAFGGADGCEIFVTESHTGSILRAAVGTRGKALFGGTA